MKKALTIITILLCSFVNAQITFNLSGINLKIYKGGLRESISATEKSYVEPYDYIKVTFGFNITAPAGPTYPTRTKMYLSKDSIKDSTDVLIHDQLFPGGIHNGAAMLGSTEQQLNCELVPPTGQLYVIHVFDVDYNGTVKNNIAFKKFQFYNKKISPLYLVSYIQPNATQVNPGSTLNMQIQVTNNTSTTQGLVPYKFYLSKTNTFDPAIAILDKEDVFFRLPTGDVGFYDTITGTSIDSKKTKIIMNYPLLIKNTVPSGFYYIHIIRSGDEKDHKCLDFVSSNQITIGTPTAIDKLASMDPVVVYPNPVKDIVSVDLGKNYSAIHMEVVNVIGTTIFTQSFINQNKIDLDLAKISNGIYFINATLDNVKSVYKVIKSN